MVPSQSCDMLLRRTSTTRVTSASRSFSKSPFAFVFVKPIVKIFIATVGRKHNVRNGDDWLVVGLSIATSAGTSANAIVAARPMLVARGASLR